jgi:DNA-binding response OmpR family regulator
MLIELNRFMTTEEVRKVYRIPDFLADEILPNLPVAATAEDGTRFHTEKELDEFVSEYSKRIREVDQAVVDELIYGPILVSKSRREATINGKTYTLDAIQLDVLACLVASKGAWVTRSDMQAYSQVLGQEGRLDRSVKKLKKSITVLNDFIKSSSRGYQLVLGKKKE